MPQRPERVYAFLAYLRNHWQLSRRFAELEQLDGDRQGGRVRIRGPLGFSRVARTRVEDTIEPSELRGEARVGRSTLGVVRWTIDPDGSGSRVTLAAEVVRASALDRAVLAVGGELLLRRMFTEALDRLGRLA